jgi:putative membrane protein
MTIVAVVLVALVAALHLGFLVLEMFLWATPTGRGVFGLERDFAERSRALAANQGLYNGFLVAGLVVEWGLPGG